MRPTPRPTYRPCRTPGCPVLVRAPADHCPHHEHHDQAEEETSRLDALHDGSGIRERPCQLARLAGG